MEVDVWKQVVNIRPGSSDSIQQSIRRFLLLLKQGCNVINILLEGNIIIGVCNVKVGKTILEALSVTQLGGDGTRPEPVAVGVKRITIKVKTWMEY